jgi:hypothetical protein
MSNDQSDKGRDSIAPKSVAPSRRGSLKELAEKAKNTPAPAPVSVAPPARAAMPSAPPVSAPTASTPAASSPSAAPTSLKDAAAKAKVRDEQKSIPPASSAPSAPRAAASEPPESAAESEPPPAKVVPIGAAKAAKPVEKKEGGSSVGLVVGGLIAVAGLAAAYFIVVGNKKPEPGPTAQATATPVVTAAATETPKATAEVAAREAPTAAPEPSSDALDLNALDDKAADAGASGPGALAKLDPSASAAATTEPPPSKPGEPKPDYLAEKGDLDKALENAAGGGLKKTGPGAEDPAATPAKGGNQSIPEQPSQGKVTAAMGAVMGNAKACVAGADDVSRASVTFGSNGAVTSVSVSGWAASNGAAGCIKSALKAANVGAFSKASYAFSVTIRP